MYVFRTPPDAKQSYNRVTATECVACVDFMILGRTCLYYHWKANLSAKWDYL